MSQTEPSTSMGSFVEKGYQFEAYMPASDEEIRCFLLKVARAGQSVVTVRIVMDYAPLFGIDSDDKQRLEAVTQRVIDLLPDDGPDDGLVQRLGAALPAEHCSLVPLH